MTNTTDERRRSRAEATPSGGENNVLLQLHVFPDDPEVLRHQIIAQVVYEGRRRPDQSPWSKTARKDRVTYYSLTDGLV